MISKTERLAKDFETFGRFRLFGWHIPLVYTAEIFIGTCSLCGLANQELYYGICEHCLPMEEFGVIAPKKKEGG